MVSSYELRNQRFSYMFEADVLVAFAKGVHLFPYRTEQLSPSAPMVSSPLGGGRVGRRQNSGLELLKKDLKQAPGACFFVLLYWCALVYNSKKDKIKTYKNI